MESINVTIKDGKAYIASPYSPAFVSRVKALGGRWNAQDKTWSIPEGALDGARKAMLEVYGETDQPTDAPVERVTVVVTLPNGWVSPDCSPLVFCGRVVASAWGRDSGAKVGDNVAFVAGRPYSGGSRKNWDTRATEDSVIEIYDVPLPKAEAFAADHPEGMQVSIRRAASVDKTALLEEKNKLLARLAEIDKLLAE